MANPTDGSRGPSRRGPDDDLEKTLILKPAAVTVPTPARQRSNLLPAMFAAGAAVVLALAGAWYLLAPTGRPSTPTATASPAVPSRPVLATRSATEAEIAAHRTDRMTVFRLADNPRIIVLDYPNLAEQGQALNRVAAFVEKASAPRDRVLDDAALAIQIAQAGETADSYYFGHDYRVSDILRFFALADRDGIRLNPEEEALRALIPREGLDDPATQYALITVSQAGGEVIDDFTRRIILRHELSHGEYFTNAVYSAYVRHVWTNLINDDQRGAFHRFLGDQAYDTENIDLIANEMQAFLVFTPDDRYISDERLGLPPGTLRSLRDRFVAGMPDGWLKQLADLPLP